MLQCGLIKKLFGIIRTTYQPLFILSLSPQKKSLIELTSKSKSLKVKSFQTYITEYLLHEHYDLVEKGCYNRSTKIDLLGNWHIFWSQISSGYLCYAEFSLRETEA